MKITRLQITNYRGIDSIDAVVPPAGITAKGTNGKGKTSVLKAIRAALAATDIGADAIRIGADRSEILVDIDNINVRRLITRTKSGGGLTVSQDIGNGVMGTIPSPQTFLTNLLGNAPLDPIDLFTAEKKKRRATVLAALPVKVTIAQLRKYVPDLPAMFDVSGHGLEVLERVRKAYYDARTVANATSKTARADADRAKGEATRLAREFGGCALALDMAEASHKRAKDDLARLESRVEEARSADERMSRGRARVAELRAKAVQEAEGLTAPNTVLIADHEQLLVDIDQEIAALELKLDGARNRKAHAELELQQLAARASSVKAAHERAAGLEANAAELEATIAEATVTAPTEEQLGLARTAVAAAAKNIEASKKAEDVTAARAKAQELEKSAVAAETRAFDLDGVVSALTNQAPHDLLTESDVIPGLTLEGDDVLLDGVSLDGLCGAEQLRFAVEIARRANAKSKILVVDGLERIDPDLVAEFVKYATAGDYQLIASRVDRGEIVLEAIEGDSSNGAPKELSL